MSHPLKKISIKHFDGFSCSSNFISQSLLKFIYLFILVLITSFISNSWRQFSLQMLYTQMPVDLVSVCIKYWAYKRKEKVILDVFLFSFHFTFYLNTKTCELRKITGKPEAIGDAGQVDYPNDVDGINYFFICWCLEFFFGSSRLRDTFTSGFLIDTIF